MPRDNRCMHMAHVSFYSCCSDCVGSVEMFVVRRSLFKIVSFSLVILRYVVCLCKIYNGCYVFVCMSACSCRCCMFVACVHPVADLNAAF